MSATRSLFERRDCIIIASVSCIYGIGSPEAYYGMLLMLEKGQKISREEITARLVSILYERNEGDFKRRVSYAGDIIELISTYDDSAYRIGMWGDETGCAGTDRIPLTRQVKRASAPAHLSKTHYVMQSETRDKALRSIENELHWWKGELEKEGKRIEAQRALATRQVRSRDDQADRLLPRHRELFAPQLPGGCRVKPAHAAGLSAARCADVSRRKPPDAFRSFRECITVSIRARNNW